MLRDTIGRIPAFGFLAQREIGSTIMGALCPGVIDVGGGKWQATPSKFGVGLVEVCDFRVRLGMFGPRLFHRGLLGGHFPPFTTGMAYLGRPSSVFSNPSGILRVLLMAPTLNG
jgi:hypothetical protein